VWEFAVSLRKPLTAKKESFLTYNRTVNAFHVCPAGRSARRLDAHREYPDQLYPRAVQVANTCALLVIRYLLPSLEAVTGGQDLGAAPCATVSL
jgi:hypothetical protein